MSIVSPEPDSKTEVHPCATMGCLNPATLTGTLVVHDEVFRDVAYCAECAGYLHQEFTPTGRVVPPRRYVVGTYCPRGGGHFELMGDEDYDGSCGSKGWPLFVEVEDGDDLDSLPEGYFEDEQR